MTSRLASVCLLASALCFASESFENWTTTQRETAIKNILANTSPVGGLPGSIVASPSKTNPDYFYHWVRDSSLVIQTFIREYERATNPNDKRFFSDHLNDFIDFARRIQRVSNPSGSLGEPRFNIDGSASFVGWPRPQNDGPALRALAFIRLARVWLAEGKTDLVRLKLYNREENCVIKPDLEYVSHQWQKTSFDLWEELHGHHFFTSLAQYRALSEGAALAIDLGDFEAGGWYRQQAELLTPRLIRHWSDSNGYLLSTIDRDGGIDYKTSNLDTSVLIGLLQGDTKSGPFPLADDRVIATVQKLSDAFRNLYSINQKGVGLAMGRYPEDRYDGHHPNALGNPWFINTATFGEYYYRLAREIESRGEIQISDITLPFFRSLSIDGLQQRQNLSSKDVLFAKLVRQLRSRGDDYLSVVKDYSNVDGSLREQFNRDTGTQQGAPHLTWSYSAVVSAIDAR